MLLTGSIAVTHLFTKDERDVLHDCALIAYHNAVLAKNVGLDPKTVTSAEVTTINLLNDYKEAKAENP